MAETAKLKTAEESLEKAQSQILSLQTDIEACQQSLDNLKNSNGREKELQQEVHILTKHVEVKENEMRRIQADATIAAEEQNRRATKEMREKENLLTAEVKARQEAESCLSQFRLEMEQNLREDQEKHRQQLEGLHNQLAEAQDNRKSAEQRLQESREKAEEAIKTSSDKHKAEILDMKRRLQDNKTERQDDLRKAEEVKIASEEAMEIRIQEIVRELEQEKERRNAAESGMESLKDSLRGHLDSHPTLSQPQQPAPNQERPHPDTVFKKPRKKVDRQTQSVIEVQAPRSSRGSQMMISQQQFEPDFTVDDFDDSMFEITANESITDNHGSFEVNDTTTQAIEDKGFLGSPSSQGLAILHDSMKENDPPQLSPNTPRQRSQSTVLRELTVDATTPVQAEKSPAPARVLDIGDLSSSGMSEAVENPFEIYGSPGEGRAIPKLFRPPSNTSSKVIRTASRNKSASGYVLQNPRKLTTIPEGEQQLTPNEKEEQQDSASTPDYISASQTSTHRMTTYGQHPSQGSELVGGRSAPQSVMAPSSTAVRTAKRAAAMDLQTAGDSPPSKRLRSTTQGPFTQPQPLLPSSLQSQSLNGGTSFSQTQQGLLGAAPRSTRSKIGAAVPNTGATSKKGAANRRKSNKKYDERFSQT